MNTAPATITPDQPAFWAGFYDLLHEAAERCRRIMAEVEQRKATEVVSEASNPAAHTGNR